MSDPSDMCRHDLLTECRILLLHGLLHLLGWDHEPGPAEADSMAAAERQLLAELGWRGDGLVGAATVAEVSDSSPKVAAADGEVSVLPTRPLPSLLLRHLPSDVQLVQVVKRRTRSTPSAVHAYKPSDTVRAMAALKDVCDPNNAGCPSLLLNPMLSSKF